MKKPTALGQNKRTADEWFWPVVILYAVFWTVAPVFVIHNYRPDLMEMLLTGQNWVLATAKHGALTCWLVEIVYVLSGRASWSPYFTAQLCVLLSLVGIYAAAKEYLSPKRAVLAPLCMLAYYFFHFESTLYNNHTTLAVFWIWSAYFCLKAFETNRFRWWLLTGMTLGLGIYSKMTIFFLVLAILLFMTADRRARKFWRSPGPYVTTAVCFLIYLPLFIWNVHHDFANFAYAFGSASDSRMTTPFRHVIAPISFLAEQLLYVAPISIPLIPLAAGRRRNGTGRTDAPNREKPFAGMKERYLLFLFWVPLVVQILFSAKSGSPARGALGCHLWFFWPLICLIALRPDPDGRPFRRAFGWSLTVPAVIMAIFILGVWLAPAIEGHASRYHYPGKQLGETVTRLWRERFSSPIPFVIGDEWLTQNVSVYGADRARLWDPQWATEEEFRRKGGVLLWEEGNEESMGRKRDAERLFPYDGEIISLTFKQRTSFDVPPARVWLGFYPPSKERPEKE